MTTASQPSTLQRAMTWLVLALAVLLLLLGISWYGFSLDVHHRFWVLLAAERRHAAIRP